MGRKERREREQRRENYASKHSAEQRKHRLIAIGVFAVIGVIVGYAAWMFVDMDQGAPGGPQNAGALGSDHAHAGISMRVFGDEFDFSAQSYQLKSPWIHFEGRDGTTIHKHAVGVTLGYLFESLSIPVDEKCLAFPDGRNFCTNDDHELVFYINGEQVQDIRDYEIIEDDKILISYGAETPEDLQTQLSDLEFRDLVK